MIDTNQIMRQLSSPVKIERGVYEKKQITKWENRRAASRSGILIGLETGLTTIAQLAERIGMSNSYTKTLLREMAEEGLVKKVGKEGTLCRYYLIQTTEEVE